MTGTFLRIPFEVRDLAAMSLERAFALFFDAAILRCRNKVNCAEFVRLNSALQARDRRKGGLRPQACVSQRSYISSDVTAACSRHSGCLRGPPSEPWPEISIGHWI